MVPGPGAPSRLGEGSPDEGACGFFCGRTAGGLFGLAWRAPWWSWEPLRSESSPAGAANPSLQVSAPGVNFGNLTLGDGDVGAVTVTNTSGINDFIPNPVLSGDVNDFFVLPNIGITPENACTAANPLDPTSLEVELGPTQSCTYFVGFTPGALGARSATYPFNDGSGATLLLTGTGTIGYYQVSATGKVASFGDAKPFGDASAVPLNSPIVGIAQTGDDGGYWLVASDGGIFNYGDAGFFGSAGGIHLNKPIVGMASTGDGQGYWLVATDGGIFTFGDASFYGSTGSIALNKPIVGMAPTPDGGGYWLVASDGGIFNLRRCRLLRLGRQPPPEQAHRRHGGNTRRRRVLARGLRRGHLQLSGTPSSTARPGTST